MTESKKPVPTSLRLECGRCTHCGEMTEIGQPCCNSPVWFEGSTYTREQAIEIDADNGLCCNCPDCMERDEPCGCDCGPDTEDSPACQGCLDAEIESKERDAAWRRTTGRY